MKETATTRHIVLPYMGEGEDDELCDEELEMVFGESDHAGRLGMALTCLHGSVICGQMNLAHLQTYFNRKELQHA